MKKSKILVVYYSRTGTTRKIAVALAKMLKCDIEEILDTRDRTGWRGFLLSIFDVARKRQTEIVPLKRDVSSYDLVLIGSPVWAGAVSTPVRTFLTTQRIKLPQVAFFCTLGGRDSDHAFKLMQELADRTPRACCANRAADVMQDKYQPSLDEFVRRFDRQHSSAANPELANQLPRVREI